MAKVDASATIDTRWYVWAHTAASAKAQVTAHLKTLGLGALRLKAKRTGMVRPQGYEYTRTAIRTGRKVDGKDVMVEDDSPEGTDLTGRVIGGGKESNETSIPRWAVDMG